MQLWSEETAGSLGWRANEGHLCAVSSPGAKSTAQWSVLCFDLDGTLCDTREGIIRSLGYAMQRLNIPAEDRDLSAFIGPPLHEIFSEGLGVEPARVQLAVDTYREFYAAEGMYMNHPYPGIPELLAELAQSGVKLTVGTAKPWIYAEKILEAHGLLAHFDFVSGPELDGTRRTKPEIISYALAQIESEAGEHVLMIGDRHYDTEGARALGIDCVGVDWGFAREGELDAARPAHRVGEVDALSELLRGRVGAH
jgi:phosphoglycolate phosphatase